MTRHLRIAAAIVFALLAWAFIGLWVRSYSLRDQIMYVGNNSVWFTTSGQGGIALGRHVTGRRVADSRWLVKNRKITESYPADKTLKLFTGFGHVIGTLPGSATILVPFWFLAASSFALAALLAFKKSWRFSVRSILIATTLLAIALGLGVYLL